LKYEIQDQQDLLPVAKAVSVWKHCSLPGKQITLLDLLQAFRNRLATDPRDKVYATFGIATELADVEAHGFRDVNNQANQAELAIFSRSLAYIG
jgi:hypothetical protein